MEPTACSSCHKPKAQFLCGICKSPICKKCAELLPQESFSFLKEVPEDLKHSAYCSACFNVHVSDPLEAYQQIMALAENVLVFYKPDSKKTRLLKRSEKPLIVESCTDKDEALLRLAFLAAHAGFNTLLDVDVTAQKVRNAGYQTSKWQAVGVPIHTEHHRFETPRRARD